ncbi:MAG: archease [Nanoarchaeota archaeon]|nr:archease [Nanoarchaeota archaeon]
MDNTKNLSEKNFGATKSKTALLKNSKEFLGTSTLKRLKSSRRNNEDFVGWKYFKHTADIKFQAFGKTKEECYVNAGLAFVKSMVDEDVKSVKKKKIKVKGNDDVSLLYNFLEELLVLLDSEEFVVSKIEKMKIDSGKLSCEISGDKASNYEFHIDVKAITYSEMFVKKEKSKYVCQVVLDV